MSSFGDRIVALIDMDCFFCQVEVKLNPELKGKPLAVIQYSSFGPGRYYSSIAIKLKQSLLNRMALGTNYKLTN